MSNAVQEFSRYAHEYDTYNVIQAEVAASLVSQLPLRHFTTVMDMGCGSGEIYKNVVKQNLSFDHFIALDSSKEMLEIHPSETKIEKLCADFNMPETFEKFSLNEESLFISSSALQWSKDLDFTLSKIAERVTAAYFTFFTSNTFKTLHRTAGITSPIYNAERLQSTIEKYFNATFELKEYKLHFNSVREMFNYIKKSGVSGGEKQLSYKQTKALMQNYPLDYLEFEVLFVEARSLRASSL